MYGQYFLGKVRETMATSKIDITQMNAIPYIAQDDCSLTPTISSGLTITGGQTGAINSITTPYAISNNINGGSITTASSVFYDDDNNKGITLPDGDVNIQGTCVLKELQLQTLQIEALTDIIEEMLKEKRFDIEFDLKKRVDQKLFIKKLSSK